MGALWWCRGHTLPRPKYIHQWERPWGLHLQQCDVSRRRGTADGPEVLLSRSLQVCLYTLNITQFGKLCITWWVAAQSIPLTKLFSSSRIYDNSFYPDNSIRDARNYCHNPSTEPYQIWCYTNLTGSGASTWGNWDYCSPEKCPNLGRYRTSKDCMGVIASQVIGNSTACSIASSV